VGSEVLTRDVNSAARLERAEIRPLALFGKLDSHSSENQNTSEKSEENA
jgi:hypothetical protein